MGWKRALLLLVAGTLMLTSAAVGAPTPTHVHFTAAGDFGMSNISTAAVLDGMDAVNPDLTLALGDLSYAATGQEQAWCDFVTAHVGAGYPFELVAGNHESDGFNGNINDFSACLPNQLPGAVGTYGRQYYVDVPQDDPLVRFVMISPGITFPDGAWSYAPGSARYQWTSDTIDGARTAGIPWVVVGMHKPCLSVGVYSCEIGAGIVNLLMAKKVDLVLSGHEHSYMRTKQLALGTGCASLAIGSYDADCVRDGDADLVAGAGTVFVTIGTGGVAQRDINAADPEMPYFAATAGLNQNRTFGFGDFDLTPERIAYSFQRAPSAGGTFSDAFTIVKGAAPPNSPPVASFTSTVNSLQAGFDSTGSVDPDGTIVSYSWAFGDGQNGTGPSPQHTYAEAGTYNVVLTVTDNAGATDAVTRPVTVTPPPEPGTLAADGFERTVVSGWGTADAGGSWTLRGPATRFNVTAGAGSMALAAGQSLYADLLNVSTTRSLTTAEFSVDKIAEGTYIAVVGRQIGSEAYVARLRLQADGQARLYLLQNYNNVATSLLVPGLTIQPNEKYRISLEVVGVNPTRVSAKVWKASAPEPVGWQRTGTNTLPALQAPGRVGVFGYLPSSGSAQAPVTVSYHDLRVVEPPL